MADKTRYILVVFDDGIGYTYQTDDNVRCFFSRSAVAYKKLAYAKRKAEILGRRYPNNKVCVFKTELDETLSCSFYRNWRKDENRLMFEFLYNN